MRPGRIGSCLQRAAIVTTFVVASVWMPLSAPSAATGLADLDKTLEQVAEKALPTLVQIKAESREQPPAARKASGASPSKDIERKSSNPRGETGAGHGGRFDDRSRELFQKPDAKSPPSEGKGDKRTTKRTQTGAGIIVSSDGRILTTTTMIQGAERIVAILFDGRFFEAKVVAVDKPSGLAVIKIDADNLPVAKFGDSDKVRVGQIVLALGHPFGMAHSVVLGIVSAKDRAGLGIFNYEEFIQTDATINPGYSGGPLLNTRGEVIGINAAMTGREGRFAGVSFAIPSNLAVWVMDSLAKEGVVRRSLLGVQIQNLNEALAMSFGRNELNGALVSRVVKDSAAERAGFKTGDIIVEFEGNPVKSSHYLKKLVANAKPGSRVTITVARNKKAVKLQAVLGSHAPESSAAPKSNRPGNSRNPLGIQVEKLSEDAARKMDLEGGGLLVKVINPDAPAMQMGLRVGDVILTVDGNRVKTVKAFNKAMANAKAKKIVRLTVQRGRSQLMVAAQLD